MDLRRDKQALIAYTQALQLNPHHAGIYNNLGLLLAHMQHPEEAIHSYQRAIELEPDNAIFSQNLSLLLEGLERRPEGMYPPVRAEAHAMQSEGRANPETPNPEEKVPAWQAMPPFPSPPLWLL